MLKRFGFERALRSLFYWYGGLIARYPLYFVILPLVAALGIGSGMLFLDTDPDVNAESLYAPQNSKAAEDRALIDDIFSSGGEMLPQHQTGTGVYSQVVVKRKDGGNVFTQNIADEVLALHKTIESISIEFDGENYSYFYLCMKWHNNCIPSGIIHIFNSSVSSPDFSVGYPITEVVTPSGVMPFFVGGEIAAVTFKDGSESEIVEAKAIQLTYNLNDSTLGLIWEEEFLKTISDFTSPNLDLHWISSTSLQEELDKSTSNILGKFSITFCVLIMFTIASCSMADSVRSKPWLANLGVFSAGLAVITTFGLMTYLGVPFVNVVGSTPFLIIGIGIDDMFLMVAAWRKTDVTKSTEHRMKEAFSEAAVSITITSITDALAFGVGAITPFYSIRIFCLYTGVAIVFDYIFQITFFAGCMALMGYREEKNLHVVTCRKVLPKDEAPSTTYRIFCAGGSNQSKVPNYKKSTEATQHAIMNFFRDTYGPFVTSVFVVPLVVVLYIGYLGVSIWGTIQLKEGLTLSRLAPYGSYAADYYDVAQEYFSTYGPPVAVVVTEQVDYSNQMVQDELRRTLSKLESSRYFHDCCSSVWFADYMTYLSTANPSRLREMSSTELFKGESVRLFLQQPAYQKYSADIVFHNSTGNILSSRFYVIPKDTSTSNSQKDMMLQARKIVSQSRLPMIAYSNVFPYYEQYVAVLPNTIQNLGIAVGAMFVVSLVMLPNLLSSILMCFSLASIIIGIVGFMSLWSVTLDLISMINLIVSIGFTVDFSAHIIYAYLAGPESTPRKSAIHALYTMGMPITQAAASTILAILILMTSDTYIFICFFKVMTLVMGFGALHGLVFLPVFLMLCIQPDKKGSELEHQQVTSKVVAAEIGEANPGFDSTEGPYIVRQDDIPSTISESISNESQDISE